MVKRSEILVSFSDAGFRVFAFCILSRKFSYMEI